MGTRILESRGSPDNTCVVLYIPEIGDGANNIMFAGEAELTAHFFSELRLIKLFSFNTI